MIKTVLTKMSNFPKRAGLDNFVLSLFGAIFLAWIYPYFGAKKGLFSISTLANFGVSVIFFFYGLRLNWKKIQTGLANVKMHVVVVLSTFLLFPILILSVMLITGAAPTHDDIVKLQERAEMHSVISKNSDVPQPFSDEELIKQETKTVTTGIWLGVFFLATLPSTVSSSVVMTNIARGNVPASIFDASVSSLLGVFITPLWMRIFIDASTGGRGFSSVLLSLSIQVLAPVCLGIYANKYWGEFSQQNDKKLRTFDQGAIILIVYVSFCNSFAEKMFDGISGGIIIGLTIGMTALFFFVCAVIFAVCRLLCFNREDMIATLFCGSKKSLVHGAAMSRVILGVPQMAGILILPTMIYHAMQLIVASILAQRFARNKSANGNMKTS